MSQIVVQELNKQESSELQLAIRYFTVIVAVANLHLTKKQIYLLAHTAVKGNISSGGAQQMFIDSFDSSLSSLRNMKTKLVKLGLIVRDGRKYHITPSLALNFKKSILLQINLDLKPDGLSEDGEDKTN